MAQLVVPELVEKIVIASPHSSLDGGVVDPKAKEIFILRKAVIIDRQIFLIMKLFSCNNRLTI